jgi:hypothetical protein
VVVLGKKVKYDEVILIRVSSKEKRKFKELCDLINEDMSDVLRDFIQGFNEEYKKIDAD